MSGEGGIEGFEWAVKNGDLNVVQSFVTQDKSIVNETLPSSKRPPLCVAADFGQTDVIAFLIECGADLNKSDKYGITPLLSAVYEGHASAVAFLLSKGADKTLKAPDGKSYADCADKDSIKQLLM